MAEFEPKIVMFCCNWCSYAGADLAGVGRLQYPTNTRIIRVVLKQDTAHVHPAGIEGRCGRCSGHRMPPTAAATTSTAMPTPRSGWET